MQVIRSIIYFNNFGGNIGYRLENISHIKESLLQNRMISEKRDGEEISDDMAKRTKLQTTHHFDMETLKNFYDKLFPYNEFFQWLSYTHGNNMSVSDDMRKRELSFSLPNDIYCRFLGFSTAEELKKQLVSRTPVKIDIGGIYNEPMSQKDSKAFKAIARELVFDIDMDDYSPIRHCCEGANICIKCWSFMNNALMILNKILTEEFGFKHILFVFSGRRGVHIWVCDRRARNLTDNQRKAIVDYLSFSKTNMKMDFSLRNAAESLRSFFEHEMITVDGQDVLKYDPSLDVSITSGRSNRSEIMEKYRNQRFFPLLECLPDRMNVVDEKTTIDILTGKAGDQNGIDKWTKIQNLLTKYSDYDVIQKIILTYTYPRLDKNVSLLRHHLLKSPFIIHPKSCCVCCPIDPDKIMEFNPFLVPHLDTLFESEESWNMYKGYIELFKTKFLAPLIKECNIEDNLEHGIEADKQELF